MIQKYEYEHRILEIYFSDDSPYIQITRNGKITTHGRLNLKYIKPIIAIRCPVLVDLDNSMVRYYIPKQHLVEGR